MFREESDSFDPISVGNPRLGTSSMHNPSSPASSSSVEPSYFTVLNDSKSSKVEPQVVLGYEQQKINDGDYEDNESRNGTDSQSAGASTKKTSNQSKKTDVQIDDATQETITERSPPPEHYSNNLVEVSGSDALKPPKVVQHVDERAKAEERKFELEKLRQKSLAKSKGTVVPFHSCIMFMIYRE